MFTEILNSFLNVRNKVKNADGDWVDQTKPREEIHTRTNSGVNITDEIVVFEEWGKKVIIDAFTWGSDTQHQIYPRLYIEEGASGRTGSQLFVGVSGSPSIWDMTMSYINYGNDFFGVGERSTSDNRYTAFLKSPIVLPNGGKLIFTGGSSSADYSASYSVVYRTIEG